jgi:hypothetical protein
LSASQSHIDGGQDEIAIGVLAREVAQLMEAIGQPHESRVVRQHMAEREERRDDAGALVIECSGESVTLDDNVIPARRAWRDVAAAVAQIVVRGIFHCRGEELELLPLRVRPRLVLQTI